MTSSKNPEKLFKEFSPVTTEQWEAIIEKDLKGADYDRKLVWKTMEGIKVQPYYRQEDLSDKEYLNTQPGEFPFTRGKKAGTNHWEIRQDIKLEDIQDGNKKALFVLEQGISSLGFDTGLTKEENILTDQSDFSNLLKNIRYDCIGLNFVCGENAPEIISMLYNETIARKINPDNVTGAVDFDPLGHLTMNGNFYIDEKTDFELLKKLMEFSATNLPHYKVLGINGYFLQNAGATIVQELGYSLSMANDYICGLTEEGLTADTILQHLQFNLGTGSNYFMEIAKLRAARMLWAKIAEAHNPREGKSTQAYIHSCTSEWNQTIYDPYVNVLRATTESMSAIMGGTDSLTVRPFDYAYKTTSKFSGRIARNIQIILKEEAYLDKIRDPGAGSYYIENLTDSIVNEAWKLFLTIENEGGYLEALKKGIIQNDIEAIQTLRKKNIASRKEVFLGTNQFPNILEKVRDEIVSEIAFPENSTTDYKVKPVKRFRGSEEFEKLRLAVENHPFGKPKVFLLTYGNPVMRKARADFSLNFFSCAGYEVINNQGFDSAKEGVEAAIKAKANIIVVCSSDEEYVRFAPEVNQLLNQKAYLVVAGAPSCMEELKKNGIEDFIHVKSNVLEVLTRFHKKLDIIS